MARLTEAGLALLTLVALVGCGRTSTGPAVAWDLPTARGVAAATGTVGMRPATQATPAPGQAAQLDPCLGLGQCVAAPGLRVGAIQTRKAGLLWRKLEAKASASNPSGQAIRAVAWARFLKDGAVVEVQTKHLGLVAPGATLELSFQSKQVADAAELFALAEGQQPPERLPPSPAPSAPGALARP